DPQHVHRQGRHRLGPTVPSNPPFLGQVLEDFADEERISLRLAQEGSSQLFRRLRAADHQADLLEGQTVERDSFAELLTSQLGQRTYQGVTTVDLHVSIGANHQQL